MSNCVQYVDSGSNPLASCVLPESSLERLVVTNCTVQISEWLVSALKSLTHLTSLRVTGTLATLEFTRALQGIGPQLLDLSLWLYKHPWVHNYRPMYHTPPDLLATLPTSLTSLDLNVVTCRPLRGDDMLALGRLTGLQRLSFHFTPSGDATEMLAGTLAGLRHLRNCRLMWHATSPSPLVDVLGAMSQMQTLELNRSNHFFPNRLLQWGSTRAPRAWVHGHAGMSRLGRHLRSVALVFDSGTLPVQSDCLLELCGHADALFLSGQPLAVEGHRRHGQLADLRRVRDLVLNAFPRVHPDAPFPDLSIAHCLRRLSVRLGARAFQDVETRLAQYLAVAPALEQLELVDTPLNGPIPACGPPCLQEIWWTGEGSIVSGRVVRQWGHQLRRIDVVATRVLQAHLEQLASGIASARTTLQTISLRLLSGSGPADLRLDSLVGAVSACFALENLTVALGIETPAADILALYASVEGLCMLREVRLETFVPGRGVDPLVGPLVRCPGLLCAALRWRGPEAADVGGLVGFAHATALVQLDVLISTGFREMEATVRKVAGQLRMLKPTLSYSLVWAGVQYGWPLD